MNNQKQIDYQELIDRKIVIELFNQLFNDVRYNELSIAANTDLTITATTAAGNVYKMHVEIKSRNVRLNDFKDCILEKIKYQHLKNDFQNHLPIYAVIYPADNTVCVWNLNKIDMNNIQSRTQMMNKVTYNNNPNKIQKDVYLMPIELSKKYNYNYAFSKQTA